MTDSSRVAVQYSLPLSLPEWELPEVPVPESPAHDELADRLRSLLVAWLARTGRPGAIRRNLAIRWDAANPRVGVDPDICFVEEFPTGFHQFGLDSLRLWLPGHRVPPLAIEIVSANHPYKDYGRVQEKYAVVGVQELWVYDPGQFGPKALGGPVLLQVWERASSGVLVRGHFSDEPARSNFLGAWLLPREQDHLMISEDREGRQPWLTQAEQERARAEQERARAEQERARADELAAEVERLKRRLDR